MKTTYKKLSPPIPEDANFICEGLYLKETHEDDQTQVSLFVITDDFNTVHNFECIPDEKTGSLRDVIFELMEQIHDKTIDGIPEDESEYESVLKSIMKVHINMMSNDNSNPQIYYFLLNGKVLTSDATKINWDAEIERIDDTRKSAESIRRIIALLLSRDEIEVHDDDNNTVTKTSAIEFAKNEIDKFLDSHKLDIDYSEFNLATERELLIAKLIDILEIYNEIICATVSIAGQKRVIEHYENKTNE